MPELPEVETTRRGIEPHLVGRRLAGAVVREPRLRWPVTRGLSRRLAGATVHAVSRRAKYLLVETSAGTVILHLGMSGSLRVVQEGEPPGRHDHVDLLLGSRRLRLRDPRRFGAVLFTAGDPLRLKQLRALGPEPLTAAFDGAALAARARGRGVAVKPFLMDASIVAGVGNIYASEALFRARVHPARAVGRIAPERMERLARAVKDVLWDAIRMGGTTLRDFTSAGGEPGRFRQELLVYEREGEPCTACGGAIRRMVQGQRATYYCPRCQR